jgi:methionyl-tRNA formyltransferase
VKICIAGKNNIAVDVMLHVLQLVDIENIYILVNKTDSGNNGWQKSLRKAAIDNNIKICSLDEIYNVEDLIFLSLEYDNIINPTLFKTKKIFNIHFSLLPKYKGMYTSSWPILNGERKSGVTLHFLDRGIDTGDIIDQKKIKIDFKDTARDLYLKYIKAGTELVLSHFNNLVDGSIKRVTQPKKNSSYYSKNSIDYKKINITLNKTAYEIHNQIRAFAFREYQLPQVMGKSVVFSKILPIKSNIKAGELIDENIGTLRISTIDYDLLIYKDVYPQVMDICQLGDVNELKKYLKCLSDINTQN